MLSWILYVVQVLVTLLVGFISIFAVFATDSCGTGATDAKVCDSDYFASVLVGYWIALVALLVCTLIALIVATAARRLLWPWAVGGLIVTGAATVAFLVLMSR